MENETTYQRCGPWSHLLKIQQWLVTVTCQKFATYNQKQEKQNLQEQLEIENNINMMRKIMKLKNQILIPQELNVLALKRQSNQALLLLSLPA